jgi:hypothetical protein
VPDVLPGHDHEHHGGQRGHEDREGVHVLHPRWSGRRSGVRRNGRGGGETDEQQKEGQDSHGRDYTVTVTVMTVPLEIRKMTV